VKSDITSSLSINILKNNLHNVLKTRWIFLIALIKCRGIMNEKPARKLLNIVKAGLHLQFLASTPLISSAAASGSIFSLSESAAGLQASLVQ